jgi:predicted amidophosphoribosyltransferase
VETVIDGVPVLALGAYAGELRQVIRAAKNYRARGIVDDIREDIRELAEAAPRGAVVVPVPSSRDGLRRRGYGLAASIAGAAGMRTARALRLLDGRSQRGLGATDRVRERLMSASRVNHPIVVVDDVVTTGSTIRASIRALRAVGNDVALVLVLAIVPNRVSSLPKPRERV